MGEIPTEENYFMMTSNKTSVLARMGCNLTLTYLGVDREIINQVVKFSDAIGIAFQIHDDIINLESQEYAKSKGYRGEDIHEGKITLMVIHSVANSGPEARNRLFEILKMKTTDQKLIDEAIGLIKASKSIAYAKQLEKEILASAWENLDRALPNNEGKVKLKNMVEFIVKREI